MSTSPVTPSDINVKRAQYIKFLDGLSDEWASENKKLRELTEKENPNASDEERDEFDKKMNDVLLKIDGLIQKRRKRTDEMDALELMWENSRKK